MRGIFRISIKLTVFLVKYSFYFHFVDIPVIDYSIGISVYRMALNYRMP